MIFYDFQLGDHDSCLENHCSCCVNIESIVLSQVLHNFDPNVANVWYSQASVHVMQKNLLLHKLSIDQVFEVFASLVSMLLLVVEMNILVQCLQDFARKHLAPAVFELR